MLAGSSFLSYQHAPLQSIRDAIEDGEHHIVRVNEEGTGEIYDLNLSRSVPYASPVARRDISGSAGGANYLDGNPKTRSDADAKQGTVSGTSATAAGSAPGGASKEKASGSPTTTTPESSAPSHALSGRRILQLPQIVSRRHGVPSNSSSGAAAAIPSSLPAEQSKLSSISNSTRQPDGNVPSMVSNARHPLAGELPPSPPLEPDMQQYISNSDLTPTTTEQSQAIGMGTSDHGHQKQESASGNAPPPTRSRPRRAATEDASLTRLTRRQMVREPSAASTASTAYMTASSQDGTDDESTNVKQSTQGRFTNMPLTAEPSSALLHPSSAGMQEANSSSTSLARRVSPSLSNGNVASGSAQAPVRQPMPQRRNTTGTTGFGQASRRRPGSVGSTGTRDSRHSSREREAGPHQGYFDESNISSPQAPIAAAPLRTGDAGFDEAIAKKYDQIRRERENKKLREQQTTGKEHETQQEANLRGGAVLSRARSGRRPTEDEPKALIGNVIGEGHVNYVLMYNMLTGIRIGVSRCQAKMKRPLTDADYTAKHKFTFDIVGNELTPSAKYDFKFKDYAPWVFRELREHFHLDAADYLLSLTAKYILSELGSPGKSGSFFYFSRDYRFIIKTIRHNEHKFLRRILKDYHLHIKENPHTLLSRFYGLHRVKLPGGKKIHFVIMNNLFPPHKDIHETYDLKGSAVGREYPEEKAAQKKGAVLKDLNWVKRGRELEFGPAKRALLEAQVRSDVALLQRLGIMDYSLLIGLHDMKRGNKEGLRQDALQVVQPDSNPSNQSTAHGGPPGQLRREPTTRMEKEAYALRAAVRRSDAKALGSTSTAKLPERETSDRHHFLFYQDEGGFRSTDERDNQTDCIYYFGIIDTLTLYNSVKRSEHYWKSLTHNSQMISAINPVAYGNRFCDFLFSIIKGADKSKRPRML